MSAEALIPCFKCGKSLPNVCSESTNQPYGGTEFRTYGHYGSTFWDSFDGEELVLNICGECLSVGATRLAQHKRFLPVCTDGGLVVGKQWVDRPMVPFTGHPDNGRVTVEPEEIGADLPNVEWPDNVAELRQYALTAADVDR